MKGLFKIFSVPVLGLLVLAVFPVSGQGNGLNEKGGPVIHAGNAFLESLQKRDSILVADQFRYGFRLNNVKEGTELWLPDYSKGFIDSVEVVSGWHLDTLKVHRKAGESDIEGYCTITSFEEGNYILPDIVIPRVRPDGQSDTLVFAGLPMDVRTMPVDTATFKPHDIKGQIRYPLTFKEVLPYILAFQLLAVLVILIWALNEMRRKKVLGMLQSSEPPYIVALKKLDKYRGNKYWAPEKQKQFYSGVTDVLREYIAARFGFGAMEMTTAEIFESLRDKDIPEQIIDETKTLFVTSDLVKFAKMTASEDENLKAVPAAVRFVTTTWKTEEDNLTEENRKPEKKKEAGNVL